MRRTKRLSANQLKLKGKLHRYLLSLKKGDFIYRSEYPYVAGELETLVKQGLVTKGHAEEDGRKVIYYCIDEQKETA